MQTIAFGKSKGLWETLTEGSWSDAYDGLGISLLLTSNPAIQVHKVLSNMKKRNNLFCMFDMLNERNSVCFTSQYFQIFSKYVTVVLETRKNSRNAIFF